MRRFWVGLVIAVVATMANAQAPTFSRVLLPVFTPVQGAYGSLWSPEISLYYSGDQEATVVPRLFCYAITCPLNGGIEPGWSAVPYETLPGFPNGVLVHIESAAAAGVQFSGRLRDITRAVSSAGTYFPAVPEAQFSATPTRLLNVPLHASNRVTLRIYGLPETNDPVVEVRYFRQPELGGFSLDTSIHVLRSEQVRLGQPQAEAGWQLRPSVAVLANIELLPELAGDDDVWIEIVPVTPGLRTWSMASITNNDSQHVTLIPQSP